MTKRRVSVVDDSEVALEWVRQALPDDQFEVMTHNLSLGFQAFVRKSRPDILLLDLNMPALRGDVVCRMLKDNPHTRDVIVALYSSGTEDDLKTASKNCSADGYVVKSDSVTDFVKQVTRLLDEPTEGTIRTPSREGTK